MADTPTTGQSLGTGIGGVLALLQGFGVGQQNPQQIAQQAAATANPFGTQYGIYQDQLHGLLSDPSSFQTDPGYQFALSQGQDAIKGAANATYGTGRVGGLAPELAKFTEGYAAQNYDNRINQLMNLTGAAPGSPAQAAQALTQGYQMQGNDFTSGISGLLSGFGDLLGKLGGGGTTINNTVQGGSGGSGGSAEIPQGGYGDYSNLYGTGPGSLWQQLGLGNQAPGNGSPIAVPGGLAGLFGTNPSLATSLSSLLGYGKTPTDQSNPLNPNPLNSGIPNSIFGGTFGQTQGGSIFGPNNSLVTNNTGGGSPFNEVPYGGSSGEWQPDDFSWLLDPSSAGSYGNFDWSQLGNFFDP